MLCNIKKYIFAPRNKKEVCCAMIIIPIKEGEHIERALKKFKRKFDKTGTVRELRARQTFVKKSVKRRDELKHAAYIQKLQQSED